MEQTYILYTTNLDNAQPYVHKLNVNPPTHILPVGTVVRFPLQNYAGFQLVVVGHCYDVELNRLNIELHLPSGESVKDFMDRMRRLRNGG